MTKHDHAKKKVLIVDDEPHVLKYLGALLQDNGYETVTANDGHEGLAVLEQEKPDLIVLDLLMPKETGTGFYRKLGRHKELAEVPVIVVSAVPGRHLAVTNPVAVFDKPIEPDAFLAAVERALGE